MMKILFLVVFQTIIPVLIAHLFDTNGINTVGNGIGHDIELIIDGDNANSIVLNDYYESDLDYLSEREDIS